MVGEGRDVFKKRCLLKTH